MCKYITSETHVCQFFKECLTLMYIIDWVFNPEALFNYQYVSLQESPISNVCLNAKTLSFLPLPLKFLKH